MSSKTILLTSIIILSILFIGWKFFWQGVKPAVTEEIQKGGSVVLLFSAEWCESCRKIKPAYEIMKKEFPNIRFYEVTTNLSRIEQKLMFKRYQIHGIPTFILYKNGKEIERVSGLQTHLQLREHFKKLE